MSTQLSTANRPLDLTLKPLIGKALKPSAMLKQAARALKGGSDIQIVHRPNSGLRTKQGAAVRMFIEEQKTALYRRAMIGDISEQEHQADVGNLRRIQAKMIQTMPDWAGTIDPKQGAIGTGFSREFEVLLYNVFNQVRDDSGVSIEVNDVPLGPVSGQTSEKEEVKVVVAPDDLRLSDLEAVEQPLDSGPLGEPSVLEVGLQQQELPVFTETEPPVLTETEEDGG